MVKASKDKVELPSDEDYREVPLIMKTLKRVDLGTVGKAFPSTRATEAIFSFELTFT